MICCNVVNLKTNIYLPSNPRPCYSLESQTRTGNLELFTIKYFIAVQASYKIQRFKLA